MSQIKEIGRQCIKLEKLEPMPNNRKYGSGQSAKALKELADSIKEYGIQQDLLVRPHPDPEKRKKGGFQIIAGCRRHSAGKIAEIEDAPCKIVECSDSIALSLRLIENLHRENLHELEEAESFGEMLNLRGENGEPIHTFESIAGVIKKSTAYIRARLKLLDMPQLAKEAFLTCKEKMPQSIALLICRIPDPKQAHKATVEVLDRYFKQEENALKPEVEAMSYRVAKEHIQNNYMKRLKGSVFNQEDETLVPVYAPDGKEITELPGMAQPAPRCGGGKCSDCPFRTGNMKAIYPDMESADVCTNLPCLKKKESAHQKRAEAKFAAQGQTLLKPRQAANVVTSEGNLTFQGREKFLPLNEKLEGSRKTVGEILEKAGVEHEVVVAQVPDGKSKTVPLTPVNEVVVAALKKAGAKLDLPPAAMSEDERQRLQAESEAKRAVLDEALTSIHEKLSKVLRLKENEDLVSTLVIMTNLHGGERTLTRKQIEKLDRREAWALMFENQCLFTPTTHTGALRQEFIDLMAEFGIDVKTHVKEAEKSAKEKAAEEKSNSKPRTPRKSNA